MNGSKDIASIRDRLQLDRYSEYVCRYEGWGRVHTGAGKTGRGYFDARQLPDGSLILGCFLEETPFDDTGTFDAHDIMKAEFVTPDGFNVTTVETILCTLASSSGVHHFSVEFLSVKLVDTPSVTEVHMPLFNFSPSADELSGNGIKLVEWPVCFSVRDLEVAISRIENADWTVMHRDTPQGSSVTAACSIRSKDGLPVDFQSVIKMANALLKPLSLAVGTRINVTTITGLNGGGKAQVINYNGIPPRPFAPIISHAAWNPNIPEIVHAWFDDAIEKPIPVTELESAVDMFVDCCSPYITIEARCLAACCLLDALALWHSRSQNQTMILPDDIFNDVLAPTLREAIAAVAANDANISETVQHQLISKVQGLNRVSFRRRIRAMFDALDIPSQEGRLGGNIVNKITDIRNQMVHEGEFFSRPLHPAVRFFKSVGPSKAMGFHDYINVLWACFCILLRLVGYQGSLPDVFSPPFYAGASAKI